MLFLPLLFQHVSEAWACPSTAWCVWSSRQHKKKKNRVRHLACDPVHQMPVISKVLQYHIHPPCIARLYSAYSAIIRYMSILFILMNCLEQVYNAYLTSLVPWTCCSVGVCPSLRRRPAPMRQKFVRTTWTKSVGQSLLDNSICVTKVWQWEGYQRGMLT